MDRRNSDDDRTRHQPGNPNVFDDEYALDPDEEDFMPAVSDGFRPVNATRNDETQDHDREEPNRPSFSTSKPADGDMRRIASRNSTMKAPCGRESISHDGRLPSTHTRGNSSQATALQHRASISSAGSFATMARSESPFGVGPSHPYGMYPQNTVARTSSVTTTSTQRQPHRSLSMQRPAHPYGMYPQNVIETPDEPEMPPAPAAIPVGFPGLSTGYHRQIGPDGEEQDIIGPDGHTEQLPPYSRYPAEGPTKAALAAEASSSPIQTTVAPLPLTSSDDIPVSPITPPEAQQPQDNQTRQLHPTSTQSTDQGLSEKQDPVAGDKGWRKRRLWGKVPFGVAVVLLVLVLIFAIILGAAIGTFVAKNKDKNNNNKHHKGPDDNPSPQMSGDPSGSMFDASPIPTPASLPPLPTGTFALPLGIAQESNPNCLTIANQLSAWSCKMAFAPLVLTVNSTRGYPVAAVQALTTPQGGVQYGVQPPSLPAEPMQLVLDLDYKALGPAFHFHAFYNKTVVLGPDEFQAGASFRKRDGDNKPYRHKFQVMPGDMPWYCYWNRTFIEGYIYVTNNSSAATMTSFATPLPSALYGTSIPLESTSATTTGGGSTPTPASLKRRSDDFPHYQAYPRIVKIEERRLPGSTQPYCQKMRLLDNAQMVQAQDGSGNPITVMLQEDDPSMDQFILSGGPPPPAPSGSNASGQYRREVVKRTDPAGACHCQWMFQ